MDNLNIFNEISNNLKAFNHDISYKYYNLIEIPKSKLFRCKSAYIIIIFFFNKGVINLNNNSIDVLPGNFIIVKHPNNISIQLSSTENNSYILYMYNDLFDSYLISQMTDCPIFYDFFRLNSDHMEYLFFDCQMNSSIYHYTNTLLLESSNQNSKDIKLIQCALILFLTNLHKIHVSHLVISESTMMESYDIGKFLKYMSNNYSTVTLTSIAEYFNFHPAYFSQLFKQLSGNTFSEKLLLIKLEQSKRLLLTTNLSIQHIVELIGFKEKSHFYRSFKKYYNLTPGEYRKKYRNRQ